MYSYSGIGSIERTLSECDHNMQDSLAATLSDSREQAESTYDLRTACEKKAAALHFAP